MGDLDLYADLITRKLVSRDGGAVTLAPFVLGDQLRCSLRTYERSEGGDLRERDLRVRTLRASLGKVLAPPTSGTFRLRFGGSTSAEIAVNATADAFKTATEAPGFIATVETPSPGTWVAKTTRADTESPPTVEVHTNQLAPISFVRVRPFRQLGFWWFECRLIQAPLAFNSGHERVLPKPPTVRRVRAGAGGSETEPPSNEIQALHLPPDFRGTYFLRWNFRVSKLLGIDDGPDEIAAALNAMFESGKRFEATNPEPDHAYIEFVGDLAGAPQALITVEVNTFAPGVLTFTLPLDRAEMAAALRTAPEIEVAFEVEAEIVDDGDDITDPAVQGRIVTLFQQPVKIVREQIWEEMETLQPIDWLRPPQPRDYIPFTPDQVLFGVQHYVAVFGDGESRSFSFPHQLGTEAIHLTVRQNQSAGKVIHDFEATFASANELLLEFPLAAPPPAPHSLALVLSSAGPRSAFLAHHHPMAQILGLMDALAGIYGRLQTIEDLIPTVSLALRSRTTPARDIDIPDRAELFPGRFLADFDVQKLVRSTERPKLPRPPGLLPAIHDATIQPVPVPLPAAMAHAGQVFRNDTGSPLLVPGGLGRRGAFLEPGGFMGSDGRVWYRLTRGSMADGSASNSFFPADFERELFLLHVSKAMWQPGERFAVSFVLHLQLLAANTRGQFLLVIESGLAPAQTTPAPVADNLADVTWHPRPLLSQRIVLTDLWRPHEFGALIRRGLNDVMTAERTLYTATTASDAPPPGPDLLLRARLLQFDTENSVRGARGFVLYSLTEAKAQFS